MAVSEAAPVIAASASPGMTAMLAMMVVELHPLHVPAQRAHLATVDAWELRQFVELTRVRGAGYVQLWSPDKRVSILTPSRATSGYFDAWVAGEHIRARTWSSLRGELTRRGVAVPGHRTMRALERWFVLSAESAAGRLLRTFWAGQTECARYQGRQRF